MKKIAILGSTGSIGTQTLDIVRANGDIRVEAIAARANIDLLEKQIREFSPKLAGVWDEKKAAELKLRVADTATKVVAGKEGILEVSTAPKAEVLVTGIVGMIGIEPTIAAIRAGKDIALANKETLVCAGHIIMPLAEDRGIRILPVDSEHSAIFQSLRGNKKNRIAKIRPLPEILREEAEDGDAGGRPQASQLEHGAEGHHRLLDHGEQGT